MSEHNQTYSDQNMPKFFSYVDLKDGKKTIFTASYNSNTKEYSIKDAKNKEVKMTMEDMKTKLNNYEIDPIDPGGIAGGRKSRKSKKSKRRFRKTSKKSHRK